VLWPKSGFTKGQAIDYYARIAAAILPHLHGRPLTLKRYPNGVEKGSFYEKRCPKHRPDWVRTAPVWSGRNEGEIDYCLCNDRATLIWMAQLAALELHPSLSLAKRIERPTVLAFDLDPGPPADILDCCRVALRLREMFSGLGLESLPKTSGSKGLQVYVPLNAEVTYERTKPFAHAVAQTLERGDPEGVVSRMAKKLRGGKVLVDWSQNDQHKTTVAVYSLRAKERPTVSTPVDWGEVEAALERDDAEALTFEAGEVIERLESRGDLFAPVLELAQELPEQ
jgi:bifunctional non-homologous end joining protein LigD